MAIEDQLTRPPPRAPRDTESAEPGLLIVWTPQSHRIGEFVALRPDEPIRMGRDTDCDVAVDGDPWASREHALVFRTDTGAGAPRVSVEARSPRNGTFVNGRRVEAEVLKTGDFVRLGATLLLLCAESPSPDDGDFGLVGPSKALSDVRARIREWGQTTQPVFVHGETGVGKELVAEALHRASNRTGSFVPVNAASIPSELAESQLFGHKRGSFSGAHRDHPGFFGEATQGTLFIDEVAELPSDLQPKLLRALATPGAAEILRVGESSPRTIPVRVVTATHTDLGAQVTAGRFRSDLYFRLTPLRLDVPSLRDRRADIAPLFLRFVDDALREQWSVSGGWRSILLARQETAWFIADLLEQWLAYPWPGNVRELRGESQRLAPEMNRFVGRRDPLPRAVDRLSERMRAWKEGECSVLDAPAEPHPSSLIQAPTGDAALPGASEGPGLAEPGRPEQVAAAPSDPEPHPEAERYAALLKDPDALAAAIREETQGRLRPFATRAGEALGRKPDSVRRQLYLVLGTERLDALRRGG